jgi:hypothetical protein
MSIEETQLHVKDMNANERYNSHGHKEMPLRQRKILVEASSDIQYIPNDILTH